MASMYSELVAISNDGRMHQWKWNDPGPVSIKSGEHTHPKVNGLRLADEKVVDIAASNVRATVLTDSGKVSCKMLLLLHSICEVKAGYLLSICFTDDTGIVHNHVTATK